MADEQNHDSRPLVYLTVKNETTAEYEEKRSRFIGHVRPVKTVEQAEEFIREIRAKHYAARHNVYAYLLSGGYAKYSDDGEPQGSAGVPVLECIKKAGVTDLCVVVTRYFGGILLGTGGLVRAYTKTAAAALEAAGVAVLEAFSELYFECPYPDYQRVLYELAGFGAIIDGTEYAECVKIRFAVKKPVTDRVCETLLAISAGKIRPEKTGERYDSR